ncbi:MAG: shikimate kinase [Deltaproteobacteria bacterium]|nr:shikimate kinase [Deltaproteobacteria bacterium]
MMKTSRAGDDARGRGKILNIYLIGYRGAGKTAVGRCLSAALGRPFCDMDEELSRRCAGTIREFVGRHGWPAFRGEEKALLQEMARQGGWVISTGGGVVLDAENVSAMRGSGRVVWLRAAATTLRERLQADEGTPDNRPALSASIPLDEEIRSALSERTPLYRQAMDFSVATDGRPVEEICRIISEFLDAPAPTRSASGL